MGAYFGTYSCGHDGRLDIYGPTKNRQYIADKKFSGLCPECAKKAYAKKIAAEAKENEYPELTGTEKQVTWAMSLRSQFIEDFSATQPKKHAVTLEWLIRSKTSARFWIDNRDRPSSFYIETYEAEKLEEEKNIYNDLIVVEPAEKKHPDVVSISYNATQVQVHYYQYEEALVSIAKDLKYRWKRPDWCLKIDALSGSASDRAAEIGNALLNAGFSIKISESLKDAAINASFEKRFPRWINATATDFIVTWLGSDNTLFKRAKKLPKATWKRGVGMVVPATSFAEIEDFASIEDFKFSKSAKDLLKYEKKRTIVAEPFAPKQDLVKEDKLATMLTEDVCIPDDLIDED